jgi:hypothetical protein
MSVVLYFYVGMFVIVTLIVLLGVWYAKRHKHKRNDIL